MLWLDTTVAPDGLLRQRNQGNTAWVALQTGLSVNALTNIVTTVLTTSGTYTKPAGLKFLEVTVIGGGGGAMSQINSSAANSIAIGGSGGGAAARKLYAASALAASEVYTVGAAGAIGAAGGTTTFKGLSAGGGSAGASTSNGSTPAYALQGLGGTASGGDLNLVGGNGEYGVRCCHGNAVQTYGGGGGGNLLCTPQTGVYSAGSFRAGLTGFFPGGGAAGGASGNATGAIGGALGGAGAIILKEYF
jgi:hypothetical protein